MSKTIMSRVVQGNSFDMEIEVFQPVYISDGTIWHNFDIAQCTNVNVNLICEKDNVVIPLQWAIKDGTTNVIVAHVIGDLLHSRTTYALELTGLDSNEQEWRYKNDHIFAVVDSNDKSILDTEIIGPLNINARIGLALYVQPVEGPQGPQGSKGDKGDVGATGAVGPQGPAGQDGLQGATGPAGQDGATGPQGAQGDRGETGPQGAQGAKGADGTMSFDDLTPEQKEQLRGPQGFQGEKGVQGDKGDVGATGAVGPQGPAGADGITGTVGPQGDRGETGPQGPQGAQGDKGDVGATGAVGPQGPAGQDGLQGATGPAGQDGATGPQGAQGEKGETGATGAVGPQGNQGDQGPIGATGEQGPQGDIGPQGPQGSQGPAGADGATGVVDYTRFATVATSGSYNDLTDKPSGGGDPGFLRDGNGLKSWKAKGPDYRLGEGAALLTGVTGESYAYGDYCFAGGINSSGWGDCTFTFGKGINMTYNLTEIAFGHYPTNSSYINGINSHKWWPSELSRTDLMPLLTLLRIGNGNNNFTRHNAIEIRQNGDIYYQREGGLTTTPFPALSKLQDVMVTAVGVTGLKIEVVSAMPASPDANTLYIVQ